jgi:hypothetical protein
MTVLKLILVCPLLASPLPRVQGADASDPAASAKEVAPPRGSVNAGKRLLFLGNSITLHGPSAKVGWPNNWGMAASAQEKDYVHVLANSLSRLWGSQPEVQIANIAEFERRYETYDLNAKLKQQLDFRAEIVIVAIGENVPALLSEGAQAKFKDNFARLLTALRSNAQPTLIVRSCFWANKAKDDIMRQACAAVGGVFVDISKLGKDESNYARSERSFAHAGVANHPGDKGMKAIADALLRAMTSPDRKQPQDKEHAAKP